MVYAKQFSRSDNIFTLNEASLILEASTKYKADHIKDPKEAENIKTLGNVGMVINTLITADPRAETYNLKGLTAKDLKAAKLAIDEVLTEIPGDEELTALSKKLAKAISGKNIATAGKVTGVVLTTAALIAGSIFAAKKAKKVLDSTKIEGKVNDILKLEDTRYKDNKSAFDTLGKELGLDPKDIAEGVNRYQSEPESVTSVMRRNRIGDVYDYTDKVNQKKQKTDINTKMRNVALNLNKKLKR